MDKINFKELKFKECFIKKYIKIMNEKNNLEDAINLIQLDDDDLIDFLFTEEDFLTRDIVDEFLRRGERMIEPLWNIIKERNSWNGDSDWWSAVHATYIIAAIGGKDAIIPLIASLRFADYLGCDWLTEYFQSMFGKIGPAALTQLKQLALDKSNNWMTRVVALEGMAAITINNPNYKLEVFDFIVSFVKDQYEDMEVRGLAANILLDFRMDKYKKSLLEFVDEEEEMKEINSHYISHLDVETIENDLIKEKSDLFQYARDWLEFYDEKEIETRREQYKKEKSWFRWFRNWWDNWRFEKKMVEWDKKYAEEEKANILPSIKLKYFQRENKQKEPIYKNTRCYICGKKNVKIGSFIDTAANNHKITCEDCAIEAFRKEHGILTREAAEAKRRRIFDVLYLFQEMVIDEYLKRNKLKSFDDLNEKQIQYLMNFANKEYNRAFSKHDKIKLEATHDQKEIEKEFSVKISLLNFSKFY